jgi:hypothetical protein
MEAVRVTGPGQPNRYQASAAATAISVASG